MSFKGESHMDAGWIWDGNQLIRPSSEKTDESEKFQESYVCALKSIDPSFEKKYKLPVL